MDIELPLADGEGAKFALQIKKWLQDIMFGVEQHPWGVVVDEESGKSVPVSRTPSPGALDRANEWLDLESSSVRA